MKNLLPLILFVTLTPTAHAMYTVDGNVSDWGITLGTASRNQGYLDTNLPTGLNVDYVTEDNADKFDGTVNVGPGFTTGNRYDAEAMYFDNNMVDMYLAVITGLPKDESEFPAGDIFIDLGTYQDPNSLLYNPARYGYAIDINQKKLYQINSWTNVLYPQHAAANPWRMGIDRTFMADIEFEYVNGGNSHYVMEAKIPKYLFGIEEKEEADIWAHWTMLCGNDFLNLHGDFNNTAPEPQTLAMMAIGLIGLPILRRRQE